MHASPSERATFIPDVHGDARALWESLRHAGCGKGQGSRFVVRDGERIIQTGDLVDRFHENFAVLDTMLELRDRVRLTVLAGNHDVMMLDALSHPQQPDRIYQWIRRANSGHTVLSEIAKREKLLLRRPCRDPLEIFPGDRRGLRYLSPELSMTIIAGWGKTVDTKRLQRHDLPTAFERAREILLADPYMALFRGMKLAEEVAKTILVVHAGVAKALLEKGIEDTNMLLETMAHRRSFNVPNPNSTLGPIVWARRKEQPRKKLFSHEIADELRESGYRAVLHGHDICRDGIQTNLPCYGIRDVNGDVGMSRGYGRSQWGYLQLDSRGHLVAESSESGGIRDFGKFA